MPLRRSALSHVVAVAALLAAPVVARAQRLPVGDPLEDYARVLGLLGHGPATGWAVRPLDASRAGAIFADGDHPWRDRLVPAPSASLGSARVVAASPALRLFWNSAFPTGVNDGAVWQGRGLTTALDAGGSLRWGPLTATLRPILISTANAAFPLAPVQAPHRTVYANPWHPLHGLGNSIDEPQRFGPRAYWTLDPGQSEIRLSWRGFALGYATEDLWWGPGMQNSIAMSDNAPGIPHAFLGTDRPVSIGIGTVEGRWIWGTLTQSRWSDSVPSGVDRFVTAAVGSFQPKFAPGLSLGATRLYYEDWPAGGLGLRDYTLVLDGLFKYNFATPANPNGNDARDQIITLFGRWAFPASGFEVYTEWARNDHSWDLRDFLLEPEHSQGYTFGFQKAAALEGRRIFRIAGELTHLERGPTQFLRATPTFYVHHLVRDGYTERGQVVGAGIGPGSNGQYLWADLFAPWGRGGVKLSRVVNDNDALYTFYTGTVDPRTRHDVSLSVEASGLVFLHGFDVEGSLAWIKELNRYLVPGNDHIDLRVNLGVRWRW